MEFTLRFIGLTAATTFVINALLQYFFKCVLIHTQRYRTLSSLPNPGRSQYVFIDTQIFQTQHPLSVYLSTNKAINLYPLNNGMSKYVFIETQSYQTL